MVGVILWLNMPVMRWLSAGGVERSLYMGMMVVAASGAYFLVLALAGVRVRHFRQR